MPLPTGPFWMVDDEPELVSATVAMLAREVGTAQVRGSTDPREVFSWLDSEKPAALITDVRMPHVNGLELVSKLHERWGPVPVVIITAYPTAQVDEAARAGRFAYLPKPFSFQALRETLIRICAQGGPAAFSGAIAVSMLGEVVQLYGLANRTGFLRVNAPDGEGEIAFESGRVIDAAAPGLRGIPAFNAILSWNSGGFSWDANHPREQTIHGGLSELLIDAYRLRDEKDAGVNSGSGRTGPGLDDDDLTDQAFDALMGDLDMEEPSAGSSAAVAAEAEDDDSNVGAKLQKLERLEGFLAAALFDMSAGRCVAALERDPAAEIREAVLGHAELVEAKRRTISRLQIDDDLEDIVITLPDEYHLLRLCRHHPQLFFYLTLDRSEANLAMARYLLSNVEKDIVL